MLRWFGRRSRRSGGSRRGGGSGRSRGLGGGGGISRGGGVGTLELIIGVVAVIIVIVFLLQLLDCEGRALAGVLLLSPPG